MEIGSNPSLTYHLPLVLYLIALAALLFSAEIRHSDKLRANHQNCRQAL